MARFRLIDLIILVFAIATALGTMRVASGIVASIVLTATIFALLGALLSALMTRRGRWIGFAVFAWGFLPVVLLIGIGSGSDISGDFSLESVEALSDAFHPTSLPKPPVPKISQAWSDRIKHANDYEIIAMDLDAGASVPLDPAEREMMRTFQRDMQAYQDRKAKSGERNQRSNEIGIYWCVLVYGWVGSMAGQFLDSRGTVARPE